jgi:hypothetical protein
MASPLRSRNPPGDQREHRGNAEHHGGLGRAGALAGCPLFDVVTAVAAGPVLSVGCVAVFMPRQRLPGSLQEQQPDHPQHGDQHRRRCQPPHDQGGGQLGAGDDDGEHGDDERRLEDQHERRGPVGQRLPAADTECVQHDQHDGLDGDAAEDVPYRDTDVAGCRRGDDDRDLRQVRRHGQQDQAAECRARMQPGGQHVGLVGQRNAGNPDRRGRRHEDQQQDR